MAGVKKMFRLELAIKFNWILHTFLVWLIASSDYKIMYQFPT